ncbi:MAG TPA: PAS domain S-box protein [Polyangiaceae bacterium]|nr:PAS domain S-box protein [Polyangiaceae bacterium]
MLRALLCVESPARAAWFAQALAGYEAPIDWVVAGDAAAAASRLRDGSWDLLLCDVAAGRASVLDGLPASHERDGVPLLIVAASFLEVASASYRLQGLVVPEGSREHLLQAIATTRTALGLPQGASQSFERGQREIVERIARGAPLDEALERIVRLVEQQAEGMACTILLLDAEQRVMTVTAPSLPAEFSRAIEGIAIGPKEGSCGAAMYERRRVIVDDIATHENWEKYRDLALSFGLRAAWSTPIWSGQGDVLGAFAMYYREPRKPSERECSWVERASYLAAIALLRHRAEQSLRASEARYRQMVDTAYEGVWLLDSQARTTFVNARTAELFGYAPEEMLGRSLFDFIDESERAEVQARLARRKRSISEQHEICYRRKNGEPLWALVAASPIHDERGNVVGALGMLTDITRLKQVEATLKHNELELRTIFDHAAIGIALVDEQGRPRRSNRAFQNMLGYSAAELREMPFPAFTHADDAATDFGLYQRMLAGELTSYQIEKRFLHREGQVVWGRLTASLVRELEGEPVLGIGMVEDITQQKRAEARISAQAALLDQAKDAILVRSCEGVIEYWNKGAERLYGWSSAEAVGRNVSELLFYRPEVFRAAQERLLEAGAWNGEVEHVTRSGEQVIVESSWTLIRDDSGRPQSVLAINSDVTEKKRLEAQVFAVQRMESLGTLAGGIAHDFNNILAAILANLTLAAGDLGPDHPVQSALSEINQASLRAAALVRQILTFSRQSEPERRAVGLALVAGEAIKLLRATLPVSVSIETRFERDVPEIFADATQVHQVVMNLGTNAAHAMSERGGVLRIECERALVSQALRTSLGELRPGTYARLVVEDQGAGMDAATIERIFDPFFTTKGLGKGTGLGLSVVHGVLRAHEGGVTVQSTPAKGTRFELYFPAAQAAVERAAAQRKALPRGRGERLLCVDDEGPIVRATTRLLERIGYEVVAHTEPRKALAELALESARFDAVVSDCSMPNLWGLEFVREIFRLRPGMPIVMTSGFIDPALERSLRELGIREFVAKPATIAELGAALDRLLRGEGRELTLPDSQE